MRFDDMVFDQFGDLEVPFYAPPRDGAKDCYPTDVADVAWDLSATLASMRNAVEELMIDGLEQPRYDHFIYPDASSEQSLRALLSALAAAEALANNAAGEAVRLALQAGRQVALPSAHGPSYTVEAGGEG